MMRKRDWVSLLGLLVCAACFSCPAESEAAYPTKPLEMIVAYPAGGGQDVNFRILAKHAEKYLGQRIVVLNKVGGGGVFGNTEIANSKPDGYTLGTIGTHTVTDDFTLKGLTYTYKSFVPVIHIAADPHVLVIKNSLNMNFAQFIEHAKKNPLKVTMSMGGTWNSHDFFRAKLEKATGARFLRMPYQGGAPAVQAVAGGHIDSSTPFVVEAVPTVEGKLVRAIAVSGSERSPALPDLPSVKELGFPAAVQLMWRGVSVPPGTPEEIIQVLEGAFTKAYNDPEFQKDLKKVGGSPSYMSRKDFTKYIEDDHQRYAALAKELGIEPK
jgi:tripartite-type tricarboxylate transporter receptor subunit TctC